MANLTVYVVEGTDSACYNLVSETQKGIIKDLRNGNMENMEFEFITRVAKVQISYSSAFELAQWFSSEGNNARSISSYDTILCEYKITNDLKFKKIV